MEVLTGGKHADRVESILRRSGPGSYSLVASQVSLGEAAAVILRRGPGAERMLEGMIALLADYRVEPGRCMPPLDAIANAKHDYERARVEPGRCMPPLDAGVLAAMNELVRLAPKLDMTDRAILAHALADPDSVFLITKDRMILNNDEIRRYEKIERGQGRRNTRLRIFNPT